LVVGGLSHTRQSQAEDLIRRIAWDAAVHSTK